MQHKTLIAAAAAALVAAAMPAQAQSAKEFEELRAELKALRAELERLKKGAATAKAPAGQASWGDRSEPLEIKAK